MIVTLKCSLCPYKFQDGAVSVYLANFTVCPECGGLCKVVETLG